MNIEGIEAPDGAERLDMFRTKLADFEALIQEEHELEPGEIRTALRELGKELTMAPELVFLLEPQEIGVISSGSLIVSGVKAELEAKKKTRPRKMTKKSAKTDKAMEILGDDDVLF